MKSNLKPERYSLHELYSFVIQSRVLQRCCDENSCTTHNAPLTTRLLGGWGRAEAVLDVR